MEYIIYKNNESLFCTLETNIIGKSTIPQFKKQSKQTTKMPSFSSETSVTFKSYLVSA